MLSISFYDGIKYPRTAFIDRDLDFFGNGVVALTDFPATLPATPNMTVNIGQGRAWVDGYRVSNDSATVAVTVAAADPANPRIDIIQIGHDDINSLPSLVVKKGVAAASPIEPGADPNYVKLWAINVPAGASSIVSGDLVDRRTLVPLNVSASQISFGGAAQTNAANTFTQAQTATEWIATNGNAPLQIPMLAALPAVAAKDTIIVVNNSGVPNWYRSDGTQWTDMAPPLVPATATTLGGIKVGSGLTVDADGTLHGANTYTLPPATTSALGGVIVGTGLTVDAQGHLQNPGAVKKVAQLTASAGQTVITLPGAQTYTPGTETMSVYIRGAYQAPGVAFTETNSTTITLAQPLVGGEEIDLEWWTNLTTIPVTMTPATTSALGGIIVGSGLSVDGGGTLSVGSAGRIIIPHVDGSKNLWFGTGKTSEPGDLAFGWMTDASGNVTQITLKHKVATDNVTVDDGAGNMTVSGTLTVGGKTVGAAATTSALGTVEVTHAMGGTPVAATRVANVNEQLLADTNLDTILTFTPQVAGTFIISPYARVITAATTLTLQINYTSAGGAQTETPVNGTSMGVGEYGFGPYVVNAVAGQPITVKIQAGTANQVYASGSIVG